VVRDCRKIVANTILCNSGNSLKGGFLLFIASLFFHFCLNHGTYSSPTHSGCPRPAAQPSPPSPAKYPNRWRRRWRFAARRFCGQPRFRDDSTGFHAGPASCRAVRVLPCEGEDGIVLRLASERNATPQGPCPGGLYVYRLVLSLFQVGGGSVMTPRMPYFIHSILVNEVHNSFFLCVFKKFSSLIGFECKCI
jgi:hypothetical protein